MRRRLGVLATLALVSLAVGTSASVSSAGTQYPLVAAYHFTGTPLAVAFFDGGASGRVAVMYEFNLKGIVRNSYAAVITSSVDMVVRADKKRRLSVVASFPRPSAPARLSVFPRSGGLSIPSSVLDAIADDLPVSGMQEMGARTILSDPPTETKFIFYVNDTTGGTLLVSNPEKSGLATQIPNTHDFQLSTELLEDYPVDSDGHTHAGVKQDYQQPSPTQYLDEAARQIDLALQDEDEARTAYELGKNKRFKKSLREAIEELEKAKAAAHDAINAGEMFTEDAGKLNGITGALSSDRDALDPVEAHPNLKHHPAKLRKAVLADLKAARADKLDARKEIDKLRRPLLG